MLLRDDGHGVLAIGQQSHAWISGQLARAWGNEQFPAPTPLEEVCLAAEQHDLGMAEWDLHPALNRETGLPYSFIEMPIEVHMELWRNGPPRLLTQSRYAALLVSMHGTRLYGKRDLSRLSEAQADAVSAFLADSRAFQAELRAGLEADPDEIGHASDLLSTWDFMSLALCLDWGPCTARGVASKTGPVDLELTTRGELHPWPFREPTLTVRAEGRRLDARYDSDRALAAALAAARWEIVMFELRSA